MLQAEADVGITSNFVKFTATVSFAVTGGRPPAVGQLQDLHTCMTNPKESGYSPRNDIPKAYLSRFVHSFNTQNRASSVRAEFLEAYKSVFWTEELRMPVFIAEYHSRHVSAKQDLQDIVNIARDKRYPFLLGFNLFEYTVRYDKGGSEQEFGMFAFGPHVLRNMTYFGQEFDVRCLQPVDDQFRVGSSSSVPMAFYAAASLAGQSDASTSIAPAGQMPGALRVGALARSLCDR
eukprot:TRINITY_DN12580_c0_g1_i1.p2 TRINITY_DN12580_c0_g1~~TRINITY_DN12580_c0_g1_i1.p2  ORF type:complete len:234 (+),score=34.97 TRINITY_DN12580_c0_g1_i1:2341-3042(+)